MRGNSHLIPLAAEHADYAWQYATLALCVLLLCLGLSWAAAPSEAAAERGKRVHAEATVSALQTQVTYLAPPPRPCPYPMTGCKP